MLITTSVSKSLNNLSPSVFNTWFIFSSDQHTYETSSSTQGNLLKPLYRRKRYGKDSIYRKYSYYDNIKFKNRNFEFSEIYSEKILNISKGLSPFKVAGIDNLSGKFLKDGTDILATPIF